MSVFEIDAFLFIYLSFNFLFYVYRSAHLIELNKGKRGVYFKHGYPLKITFDLIMKVNINPPAASIKNFNRCPIV